MKNIIIIIRYRGKEGEEDIPREATRVTVDKIIGHAKKQYER